MFDRVPKIEGLEIQTRKLEDLRLIISARNQEVDSHWSSIRSEANQARPNLDQISFHRDQITKLNEVLNQLTQEAYVLTEEIVKHIK